jgi:hypothetical protein
MVYCRGDGSGVQKLQQPAELGFIQVAAFNMITEFGRIHVFNRIDSKIIVGIHVIGTESLLCAPGDLSRLKPREMRCASVPLETNPTVPEARCSICCAQQLNPAVFSCCQLFTYKLLL